VPVLGFLYTLLFLSFVNSWLPRYTIPVRPFSFVLAAAVLSWFVPSALASLRAVRLPWLGGVRVSNLAASTEPNAGHRRRLVIASVLVALALAPITYFTLERQRPKPMTPETEVRLIESTANQEADCSDPSQSLLERGLCLINTGKQAEAVRVYEQAIQADPLNAILHNNLCVAHNGLEEWLSGIEACENAVAIAPDYRLAKNNLKWATSQWAKAVQRLQERESTVARTQDARAYRNLGLSYVKMHAFEESLRLWTEALRLEPTNAANQNNVGLALIHLGRYDEAIRRLEESIALDPESKLAKHNLRWAIDKRAKAVAR
jgi:tetratricopeptide (TPR) repeat protein